jgi:hypothetical protein
MTSRIIVWTILVLLIAYDIPTAIYGQTTISEAIRQVDRETDTLLRWSILALWAHWFVQPWFTP